MTIMVSKMTEEQPIYNEEKMQQKVVYPTKQTPSYADWALYNMGAALEEKVDGIGSGLPEHTSEDAGKVLKVTAQNEVAWATDEQGHAQVQANWNESDNTQPSYIQNKPTIPSDFEYVKNVSGGPYTITANGNTTITAETLTNEYYRKDIIVFVTYVSDKVMVKPRQEMDTNQIKFDVVNSSLETTCYIDYTIYAKDIEPGRENPEGVNICSVIGTVGRKYAAVPVSTTTDVDKVLTVGSNGVPAWQTPSDGLPAITSGDAGKVLTVNAGETGSEWAMPVSGGGITHISNMTIANTEVILAGKIFSREIYLNNLDINKKYLFIFKPTGRTECIYRFSSGRNNNKIYIRCDVYNCGTSLTTMNMYLEIYEVEGLNSDICYSPNVSVNTFPMPNNFLNSDLWNNNKLYTFVQCNGQLNTVFVANPTSDANKIVTISSDGKGFNNINEIESDSSDPTTSTVGRLGEVFINTSTHDAFICTNVDTATPEYTWKKITLT